MRLKLAALCLALFLPPAAGLAGEIAWQGWSDAAFAKAKAEKRLVLLDLGAVWCHWCHVMEETTYKDAKVVALLNEHFVAVRVDQDSRPDLSNRYEDYGWPATIVFGGSGGEIVKRQGYIEPKQMIAMLKAIIADPTPGPSVRAEAEVKFGDNALLPADLRKDLED